MNLQALVFFIVHYLLLSFVAGEREHVILVLPDNPTVKAQAYIYHAFASNGVQFRESLSLQSVLVADDIYLSLWQYSSLPYAALKNPNNVDQCIIRANEEHFNSLQQPLQYLHHFVIETQAIDTSRSLMTENTVGCMQKVRQPKQSSIFLFIDERADDTLFDQDKAKHIEKFDKELRTIFKAAVHQQFKQLVIVALTAVAQFSTSEFIRTLQPEEQNMVQLVSLRKSSIPLVVIESIALRNHLTSPTK